MKIKTKIELVAIISIALVISLGVVVLIIGQQVNIVNQQSKFFGEIVNNVFELNAVTHDYLANRDEVTTARWQLEHDHLTELLVLTQIDDPTENDALYKIIKIHNSLKQIFIELAEAEDDKAVNEKLGQLSAKSQELVGGATKLEEIVTAHSELVQQNTRFLASALVIGLIAASLAVSLFVRRSVSRPIQKLTIATQDISSGNLKTEIDANLKKSNDEVGGLASHFDEMRVKILTKTEELAKTNEELKLVDKLKDELSSMVTHELKTPLVPILLYGELLLDGKLGDLTTKQKETIEIIQRNALNLLHLIQDILDVKTLELGRIRFDMYDTSVKDLVNQCIDTFKPTTDSKNVTLIGKVSQELKLKCDPERILQVLKNLVSNALKFVPEQTGTIEVSARRDNSSILFSVKDNGIGIPKEKQQNLFKKFYQIDSSLQRRAGGTGLGLAICKGIVEAHNGKIWVESEEGKGATFYFTIPLG